MTFIGQSTRRVEDERFLTGRGVFVEDVNDPGQLWAYVIRSPHAHATIERIDTSAVAGASVFTYADIADLEIPTGQPIVYELDDTLAEIERYYLSER